MGHIMAMASWLASMQEGEIAWHDRKSDRESKARLVIYHNSLSVELTGVPRELCQTPPKGSTPGDLTAPTRPHLLASTTSVQPP